MTYLPQERRPVIASLTSADAEFNNWVAQNSYHHLRDKVGTTWELHTKLEQFPHPQDVISPLYRLQITLAAELSAALLVSSGILNPSEDARLIAMLGDDRMPVPVKVKAFEAKSLDVLRSDFASYIYKLRNELKKTDLSKLKRRLVGVWIDRKSLFGSADHAVVSDKIELEV